MSSSDARTSEHAGFAAVCAWSAFTLPLLVSLGRLQSATQWRDDVAVVRALELLPALGRGALSTIFAQLALLLPLGGRPLRIALISAVCVALSSLFIFKSSVRLLAEPGGSTRRGLALSVFAGLATSLGVAWQLEGTIPGGSSVAAAAALFALSVAAVEKPLDSRRALVLGMVLGVVAAESLVLLPVVLLAATALSAVGPRAWDFARLRLCAAALLATLCALALPWGLEAFRGNASSFAGYELLSADSAHTMKFEAVQAWLQDAGITLLLAAGLGFSYSLRRRRTRGVALMWALVILADAVFPAPPSGHVQSSALSPLRLVSLAALSLFAVKAVNELVPLLLRARLPLARKSQALFMVFCVTLVLVKAEDAGQQASRQNHYAAEIWTDEALGSLPARSLLVVRSPSIAWRLRAASAARGQRRDLLVVSLPFLQQSAVAADLVELEPALAPLVREIAIHGRPSEYSLSTLADARPLYVEFDPNWDRRLLEQLVPKPFWMKVAPHALGRSDRRISLEHAKDGTQRVREAARATLLPDEATLSVLERAAEQRAAVLAALNDKANARLVLEELSELSPKSPFVAVLGAELSRTTRSRIDVAKLLAQTAQ